MQMFGTIFALLGTLIVVIFEYLYFTK